MTSCETADRPSFPSVVPEQARNSRKSWSEIIEDAVRTVMSTTGANAFTATGTPGRFFLTRRDFVALAREVLQDVTPLYLRAFEGWCEVTSACRGRIRRAGEVWSTTGLPIDEVFSIFCGLLGELADALLIHFGTAGRVSLFSVVTLSNMLTREFLTGVTTGQPAGPQSRSRPKYRHEVAAALIEGRDLPSEVERGLCSRYFVVVVRLLAGDMLVTDVDKLVGLGGLGTLVLPGDGETIALVPEAGCRRDQRLSADLATVFGEKSVIALAKSARADLPAAHREAVDLLSLAARRGPGVYRVEDFLLEFAVNRNADARTALLKTIEPLIENSVLYETALTLVQSEFNRKIAAQRLFLHRSTIDYRLNRIRELTGLDPMSGRGIQMLTTATAVCELSGGPLIQSGQYPIAVAAGAFGRSREGCRELDTPVEYAARADSTVAERLIRIIAPLTAQPSLMKTLEVFIADEGNRSRTACVLGVHRSTLDYRLNRIATLTGRDPAHLPSLQLLAVALAVQTTADPSL
ncbi:helix-turn-helix domain-containing protein [Amycolatopsis sp. H20-H5]|uniref:helix-turn-helix domain-containing protein n=1 Tax=Amycolatopsis sp. H20-H5 TaxID=3046309 RepID=UPI002DBB3432|nr:helix-turn-helix domain-containing protein [Amycolatopsis sp. H20-H5]